jgi:hypothetical protein
VNPFFYVNRDTDQLDVVRHVPAWFPGAGFKKTAARWREMTMKLVNIPYNTVKSEMVSLAGTHAVGRPWVTKYTYGRRQEQAGNRFSEVHWRKRRKMGRERKWQSGRLLRCTREARILCVHFAFPRGATLNLTISFRHPTQTVSTSMSFFFAMSLYPDVQARAQHEIDEVVGTGRLPGFEDRTSLPYLNALVKEVLRWNPVTPLGKGLCLSLRALSDLDSNIKVSRICLQRTK